MAIYLPMTDEQAFLEEAALGALGRLETFDEARQALDGKPLPSRWAVAAQAGWPGLLVDEDHEGAGLGPFDAALVLRACGRCLADARLLGHLPATLLLAEDRSHAGLLRALASGDRRAALVDGALTHTGTLVGDTARGVLDAPGADVLVVVTEAGAGLLDPAPEVVAEASYDATRSIGTVTFDRDELIGLDVARPADGRDLQRLLLAAESLGAAEAALEMTRQYAIDRRAFGRSIGSYQAIKHKLVEMLRRIENATSLVAAACEAADDGERAVLSNAARVAAASALDYSAPEAIFVHGGIGATWEHDASLFYRRAEVARRLAGGVEAAASTVGDLLLSKPGSSAGLGG